MNGTARTTPASSPSEDNLFCPQAHAALEEDDESDSPPGNKYFKIAHDADMIQRRACHIPIAQHRTVLGASRLSEDRVEINVCVLFIEYFTSYFHSSQDVCKVDKSAACKRVAREELALHHFLVVAVSVVVKEELHYQSWEVPQRRRCYFEEEWEKSMKVLK
ncbi:hypothetical protein FOZ63_024802, partial [Perkinsus olseni]